jgi:hypothetical protein
MIISYFLKSDKKFRKNMLYNCLFHMNSHKGYLHNKKYEWPLSFLYSSHSFKRMIYANLFK